MYYQYFDLINLRRVLTALHVFKTHSITIVLRLFLVGKIEFLQTRFALTFPLNTLQYCWNSMRVLRWIHAQNHCAPRFITSKRYCHFRKRTMDNRRALVFANANTIFYIKYLLLTVFLFGYIYVLGIFSTFRIHLKFHFQ